MKGSGGPRSMPRFEHLAHTVTTNLTWMMLASCDLGPAIPTHETNPSSLQALYARQRSARGLPLPEEATEWLGGRWSPLFSLRVPVASLGHPRFLCLLDAVFPFRSVVLTQEHDRFIRIVNLKNRRKNRIEQLVHRHGLERKSQATACPTACLAAASMAPGL